MLVLVHVFLEPTFSKRLIYAVDFRDEGVAQLVELFVVMADPFFTLWVKLIVDTVGARDFVRKRVHVVAEDLFQLFKSANNLLLDALSGEGRVVHKLVLQDLARVWSVLRSVQTHLLEQILEVGRRLNLTVDFPEVFLVVFEGQFLIVGVHRVCPSEWLELHFQQEQGGGRRENVCLHPVVLQAGGVAQVLLVSLPQLAQF